MDKKCAPGKNYTEGSCFNINELIEITKSYNKEHPSDSIELKRDKKFLLKQLTSRIKKNYNCNDQVCWVDTKVVKKTNNKDILDLTFRPKGPNKPRGWLSTTDIDKVMTQYESQNKNFKFLGAVPYDFEDLRYLQTYNLNLDELKNQGITKIGMVINLDEHYKPGSHWVGLYSELNNKKIYYFDSVGIKPGKRVSRFVKKIYNHMLKYYNGNNNQKDFDIRWNKKQHQFKDTECGVYSMNFVIRSMKGESFDSIVNNITKDDKINKCRGVYFRNYK
jgi:hypothetical protein